MKQSVFIIRNMDCPTEEALIRKRLGSVPAISELAFNLLARRLTVTHVWPDSNSLFANDLANFRNRMCLRVDGRCRVWIQTQAFAVEGE